MIDSNKKSIEREERSKEQAVWNCRCFVKNAIMVAIHEQNRAVWKSTNTEISDRHHVLSRNAGFSLSSQHYPYVSAIIVSRMNKQAAEGFSSHAEAKI